MLPSSSRSFIGLHARMSICEMKDQYNNINYIKLIQPKLEEDLVVSG